MALSLDERIDEIATAAIDSRTTPGMVVAYVKDSRTRVLPFGHLRYDERDPVTEETIYDVASITKSIPTACLALKYIEEGTLSLDARVTEFIPELDNKYRDAILVRHLLTYTVVFDVPGGLSSIATSRPHDLLNELFKLPLAAPPGKRYFYTNPPAILLSLVLERLTKQTLGEQAQQFFGPLGMDNTMFTLGREQLALAAPTEVSDGVEVRGIVQDEAARVLGHDGRLTGAAGLFSTAGDLLTFCRMLLAGGAYEGKQYFKPETVRLMHTNQIDELGASTALGWEIQSPAIMGRQVSSQAFGKTGYTGCNVVIDPRHEAALVILANRTYPDRTSTRERMNVVRCAMADLVFEK